MNKQCAETLFQLKVSKSKKQQPSNDVSLVPLRPAFGGTLLLKRDSFQRIARAGIGASCGAR